MTTYVDSQRELLESEYNKMIANQDKINSAPYPTTDKGFVSKISQQMFTNFNHLNFPLKLLSMFYYTF